MASKQFEPLLSADDGEDADDLVDTERRTLPFPPEVPQAPSLDAELAADVFYLSRLSAGVPSDVPGVDAGWTLAPVIHNTFWIEGKVPSLNDLLDAKGGAKAPLMRSIIMRQKPAKGNQRGGRFDLYNDIKQDWKQRTVRATSVRHARIDKAFFGYLVIEQTLKRDPSNICSSAIKFIEDGLVEACIIPNDGWNNVLGIRVHWLHRKLARPGVFVVMSDAPLPEAELVAEYLKKVLP
jgi:hypothetical protein